MKTWLALLCACLALGLVAVGCGDDDDDDSSADTAAQEQPADTATDKTEKEAEDGGAAAPKTVEVSMKDIAFDPADVTVPKGGKVVWTNDESVGHDVTKDSGPGPDFSSGDPGGLAQGATFEQRFTAAGEVKYVCTVHSEMEGTVTVE